MKAYLSASLIFASTIALVGCPTSTSPTVISTSPQDSSVDLPANIAINATLSEAMDPSSINTSTFTLTKAAANGNSASVPGMVTLAGQVANFQPASALDAGAKYTATLTTGAKNLRGTALASNFTWSFSIVAAGVTSQRAPATRVDEPVTESRESGQAAPASYHTSYRTSRAPPPIPVYVQPRIPRVGADYIWTPGYWAWNASVSDYYWVPGTWVRAPRSGLYWTPGYWALVDAVYAWHAGYWGPTVGFYGRIDYGFGYNGSGYNGGEWRGSQFTYNNSVNNITTNNLTNVTNVTNVNVINSFSTAVPTTQVERQSQVIRQELTSGRVPEGVQAADRTQITHQQAAQTVPTLRASQNLGKPPVAATAQPVSGTGDLTSGKGVVPATKASGPMPPVPQAIRAAPVPVPVPAPGQKAAHDHKGAAGHKDPAAHQKPDVTKDVPDENDVPDKTTDVPKGKPGKPHKHQAAGPAPQVQ
jgi:hypothetical protein